MQIKRQQLESHFVTHVLQVGLMKVVVYTYIYIYSQTKYASPMSYFEKLRVGVKEFLV